MHDGKAFRPPNEEEIIEILKLVNDSDFDELRLEMDGLRLIFSKSAADLSDPPLQPAPVRAEATRPMERAPEEKTETSPPTEGDLQTADREESNLQEDEGLIPVTSPLLGIFYRSPKPGAPPFVEVGSYVTEDDTVCLIEVMKCFNTVKAGTKGRVVKVCAENNQMVEYNQTIFLLEAEESPEVSSES